MWSIWEGFKRAVQSVGELVKACVGWYILVEIGNTSTDLVESFREIFTRVGTLEIPYPTPPQAPPSPF